MIHLQNYKYIKVILYYAPSSQRDLLNLQRIQAESRLRMDIQASKTVAITVLAFLLCHMPFILFALLGRLRFNASSTGWPAFLAQFCIFISSGINPVIYCFRTRRFRSALVQLLKDPYARTPFEEPKQQKTTQREMAGTKKRQVVASNKITHVSGDPSVASPEGHADIDRGESNVPTCEEARSSEKGQSSLSGRVVKAAWTKSQNRISSTAAGAESFEENSQLGAKPCVDHLMQVCVEVHPDRKL